MPADAGKGATPNKLLYDLLMEAFSWQDLKLLLWGMTGGEEILTSIPDDLAAYAHKSQAVIDALARRRMLDRAFFDALLHKRPRYQDEIYAAGRAWGIAYAPRLGHSGPANHNGMPPGGVYTQEEYVSWPKQEALAWDHLRDPGRPVAVLGPPRGGKTWFIKNLRQRAEKEQLRVLFLDLDRFSLDELETDLSFLASLARRVAKAADLPEPERMDSSLIFEIFLEKTVGDRRTVLVLDRADRIRSYQYNDPFFNMMRSFCTEDRGPLSNLRLILGLSASPDQLTQSERSSPLANLNADPVRLEGFNEEQVRQLCTQYEPPYDEAKLQELCGDTRGNPYKLRRTLYARQMASSVRPPMHSSIN